MPAIGEEKLSAEYSVLVKQLKDDLLELQTTHQKVVSVSKAFSEILNKAKSSTKTDPIGAYKRLCGLVRLTSDGATLVDQHKKADETLKKFKDVVARLQTQAQSKTAEVKTSSAVTAAFQAGANSQHSQIMAGLNSKQNSNDQTTIADSQQILAKMKSAADKLNQPPLSTLLVDAKTEKDNLVKDPQFKRLYDEAVKREQATKGAGAAHKLHAPAGAKTADTKTASPAKSAASNRTSGP